ncbi:MAG: hypothetical protein K8S25_01010 [Alphaproteobacteria bacterium]|nr:hypothetical protein [Alphaproteobacteria bacterium]
MSAPDPGKVDPALAPPKTESMASYEGGMWLGVGLLVAAGTVYILGFVVGIVSMTPVMIAVFAAIAVVMGLAGGIILLMKVLSDRARNREDDYYSKNVDH